MSIEKAKLGEYLPSTDRQTGRFAPHCLFPQVAYRAAMVWVVGIGIFLFLLFAFPKQIGGFLLVLVGIGVVAWLYTDQQAKAVAREKAKIVMSARVDVGCSDPAFPVGVSISNGTAKRINSVSFIVNATRSGFSSSVYAHYMNSDRIMKPGDVYFACWSLDAYDLQYGKIKGVDPKTLNWTANVSSVSFDQ